MFCVFDLDGTLCDITHRVHLVKAKKWDEFFAACVDDAPNKHVIRTLQAHVCNGERVEVWSARSDAVRLETELWLETHGISAERLTHMRAAGDTTSDVALKRFWLSQIHPSQRPDVIYDDRKRVVDMWRAEGVPCFQVAPGDFDDETKKPIPPLVTPLLTLLVGPAGSGKTTYARNNYPAEWVISSDALRDEYCGDFRDQSRNADVFVALHRIAAARLSAGLPVVVDATNLRRRDRLAITKLAPDAVGVRYVVIDRPLEDKRETSGWRREVQVDGVPLVDDHHARFKSALRDIMKGDGDDTVEVLDCRDLYAAEPAWRAAA